MKIAQLFKNIKIQNQSKDFGNIDINGLEIDSRKIKTNFGFLAIKGSTQDGHQFIDKAIENGAGVVVHEQELTTFNKEVLYIKVECVQKIAGIVAHRFYDCPSTKLILVGVTGTNGKTTCATLMYQLFKGLGFTCGLISTVENRIDNEVIIATHTTPDPIQLNSLLHDMVNKGCSHVFMECSSHAIDQDRIAGLIFKLAVFTNLTQDHLDYHKNFEAYFLAKKKFFDDLNNDAIVITNSDDAYGLKIVEDTKGKIFTYGTNAVATFQLTVNENNLSGLSIFIQNHLFNSSLIGSFNAYNLNAVIAVALCLGIDVKQIQQIVPELLGAKGRFEYFIGKEGKLGIVDYAHTPDALEKLLSNINEFKKDNQELWVVFGCGGNRDKSKRPLMLAAVEKYAQYIVVTSDNPRHEEPQAIINDIINSATKPNIKILVDRLQAIEFAVDHAKPNAIIVVAGKGHEAYQEIAGVKHDFDDLKILAHFLKNN